MRPAPLGQAADARRAARARRISMSERPGLGRVHDGFFGGLFHGDPEAGCLFDQLVETIEAADAGAGRAIYLTGARPACCCRSAFAPLGA